MLSYRVGAQIILNLCCIDEAGPESKLSSIEAHQVPKHSRSQVFSRVDSTILPNGASAGWVSAKTKNKCNEPQSLPG